MAVRKKKQTELQDMELEPGAWGEAEQEPHSQAEASPRKTRAKKTAAEDRAAGETQAEEVPEPELAAVFEELDRLLVSMEQEESLEKSFDLYKKGIELIRSANSSIDKIEKQVKVLDDEGILS